MFLVDLVCCGLFVDWCLLWWYLLIVLVFFYFIVYFCLFVW